MYVESWDSHRAKEVFPRHGGPRGFSAGRISLFGLGLRTFGPRKEVHTRALNEYSTEIANGTVLHVVLYCTLCNSKSSVERIVPNNKVKAAWKFIEHKSSLKERNSLIFPLPIFSLCLSVSIMCVCMYFSPPVKFFVLLLAQFPPQHFSTHSSASSSKLLFFFFIWILLHSLNSDEERRKKKLLFYPDDGYLIREAPGGEICRLFFASPLISVSSWCKMSNSTKKVSTGKKCLSSLPTFSFLLFFVKLCRNFTNVVVVSFTWVLRRVISLLREPHLLTELSNCEAKWSRAERESLVRFAYSFMEEVGETTKTATQMTRMSLRSNNTQHSLRADLP